MTLFGRQVGARSLALLLLLGGALAAWVAAGTKSDGSKAAGRAGAASGLRAVATEPDAALTPSSRRMVERLAALNATPAMEQSPYNNLARLAKLEQRLERRPDDPKLKFGLAQEQLCAGRTAETLETLAWLEQRKLKDTIREEIESQTAISWLRLGEEQNCLARHGPDSCLLPIAGGGVHVDQEGSRHAIDRLLTRLGARPDDLQARWLLNIAYMTVGEYPDGVPAAHRIPAEAFASDDDIGRFPDVAARVGLAADEHAGGCVVDDFDGDDDLDVMASGMGLTDQLRYFENTGDGRFADRSQPAGLLGLFGGLNLVSADYDNDGLLDVLVLRGGWFPGESGAQPNSLLRNLGHGRFSDVTEEAGLLSFHPTQAGTWGDYDNDGLLDLFIGNESTPNFPHPNELYHNDGNGRFTNVAPQLGLDVTAYVKGAAFGDYDNDGLVDLFVSRYDLQPDLLYHNEGRQADGRWGFRDVAAEAGVTGDNQGFAAWWFDFDNDGWLDLYNTSFDGDVPGVVEDYLRDAGLPAGPKKDLGRPRLYRNLGNGRFVDVASQLGLDDVMLTMGCNYGDVDNDGWLDVYFGTGNPDFRTLVPNKLYRNDGGRRFLDITTSANVGSVQKGHGVAISDIDNDGDNDIYIVIGGAYEADNFRNALFLNPGQGNRHLTLQLVGNASNRDALGARIEVVTTTPQGTRHTHAVVSPGGSFGCSSRRLTIGLADASAIERVELRWPSGLRQTLVGLETDGAYRVTEGEAAAVQVELPRMTLDA